MVMDLFHYLKEKYAAQLKEKTLSFILKEITMHFLLAIAYCSNML